METLTRQAIAHFLSECIAIKPEKLQQFKQVTLHNGISFTVHKGLSDDSDSFDAVSFNMHIFIFF
jgi:hypothetical protein